MSVEYQAEYLVGNVKGASGVRLENEAVVEGVDRVVIGLQLANDGHKNRTILKWLAISFGDSMLNSAEWKRPEFLQNGLSASDLVSFEGHKRMLRIIQIVESSRTNLSIRYIKLAVIVLNESLANLIKVRIICHPLFWLAFAVEFSACLKLRSEERRVGKECRN